MLQGLRGLRGLSGLNLQDRDSWMQRQILLGVLPLGAPMEQFEQLYRNKQFIDIFGRDLFDMYDPDTRDLMLKDNLILVAFDERYLGKASDEEYNDWNALTSEGKYELLNSNIHTDLELEALEKSNREYFAKKEEERRNSHWLVLGALYGDPLAVYGRKKTEDSLVEYNRKSRDKRLNAIKERDRINVLNDAKPLTLQFKTDWLEALDNGEMNEATIELEFENIAPYLRHYLAFKGEEELKNFNFELKMNAVALYYAIVQKTGNATAAINAIDGGILNYIAGEQDDWDKTKLALGNLVTGTIGLIGTTAVGFSALAWTGLSTGFGAWGDASKAVNDIIGSDIAQYFEGMDTFNTFSIGEINKARENGGVSANLRIRAIGDEFSMDYNTVLDMAAMSKYIIPSFIDKGIVSALTKGTMTAAKGVAKWAIKHGVGSSLAKATIVNPTKVATGIAGALHSTVGASTAEAIGTYLSTLAENMQKIDQLVDKRTQELVMQEISKRGLERGLSLEDYNRLKAQAELELDVETLKEEAELAAADAYMATTTTMSVRGALENSAFRKWLLSKSTKANLGLADEFLEARRNAAGNLTTAGKIKNVAKPILNNIWGGFQDEYLDGVNTKFGEEWGLTVFNNYIASNYDPTLYAGVVDNYMAPILGAFLGTKESVFDIENFWEGFIGAGGSVLQIAPSARWAKRTRKKRKDDGTEEENTEENRGFIERLNDFIYSPILMEIEEARAREHRTENRIKRINELIEKNKDKFDDITTLAIANSRAVFGLKSGDMFSAANEKTRALFDLVTLYSRMKNDPIAREHAKMDELELLLQRVTNAKSIEDILDLVLISMSRPENLGTHEVSAEETFNAIKDNALRFLKMSDKLSLINDLLDSSLDPNSTPAILKSQLSYLLVMDENWKERLDKVTKELGLTRASSRNLSAQVGSKRGWDIKKRAQANTVAELDDALKQRKEELEKTLLNPNSKNDYKIISLKKQIQTLKELRRDAQLRLEELESFDYNSIEVISADLIGNLQLEDLAEMVNPNNKEYYSLRQLTEIDKYIREITAKDPLAVTKIMDAAKLQKAIEDNLAAYNRLISSPTEAVIWANYMALERENAIMRVAKEKLTAKAMIDIANLLSKNSGAIPTTYGPEFIDEFIKRNPSTEDAMAPLKEASLLIADLTNYIDLQENIDDLGKNYARKSLYNVVRGATSASLVIDNLERAFASEGLNPFDKDVINRALDKATLLGFLRLSTSSEDLSKAPIRNTTEQSVSTEEKLQEEQKDSKDTTNPPNEELPSSEILNDEKEVEKKDTSNEEDSRDDETGTVLNTEELNFEQLNISEEIELFDALGIPDEDASTIEELNEIVSSVDNPSVDATELGNTIINTDPEVLPGNKFPGYDIEAAREDGVLVKPQPAKKGDTMDSIHSWLDSLGINLLNIIDNELNAIRQVSPKVYFMGKKYTLKSDAVYDSLMLVVEYTPEVAEIHDKSNGGVFSSNGKLYLLIGITGYKLGNTLLGNYYRLLLANHKKKRKPFFDLHPTELYYIDESLYTEIKDFASGRIIRQINPDLAVEPRSVSSLLVNDSSINPTGATLLSDLHWGIQYNTEFRLVNPPTTGVVYPPIDATSNSGAVFIMAEAANGNFIPIAIAPTLYKDILEGLLKQTIDGLVAKLRSPKLEERLLANRDLMKILSLSKEGKWILVGNEKHNTITFLDGDTEVGSFNLDDPTFSSMDFMAAFERLNPRINITTSVLGNRTLLKIYDKAGALRTDVAKLGTSVATYTIYPIGPEGTPIKEAPPVNGAPNTGYNSDLAKLQSKLGMTLYYRGTEYRKRQGKWYKPGSNTPIEGALAESVEYANKIRGKSPNITTSEGKFYVLSPDTNNPIVVKELNNGEISVLSREVSLEVIRDISRIDENIKRENALKAALIEIDSTIPTKDATLTNLEDVELEDVENVIADLMTGDFSNIEVELISALEDVDLEDTNLNSDEGILSSDNVNTTSTTSIYSLDSINSVYSAAGIACSREYGDTLFEIVEAKMRDGIWEVSEEALDDFEALTKLLESKGIQTVGISDVEVWLNLIKNCKN